MRSRLAASRMQWKLFQANILLISCLRRGRSRLAKSMRIWWSRYTSSFSMKYTMNTSFSTCFSLSPPYTHSRSPASTSALFPRLVATSLLRKVPMYLLRSSSVSLLSFRYSFTRGCSVANAWSRLVICWKAASFLAFTFFSRAAFSFTRARRRTSPPTRSSRRSRTTASALLSEPSSPSNASVRCKVASSSRKQFWRASAAPRVSNRMALAISVSWEWRASVRSGKAWTPRWNSNSSSRTGEMLSRQCGSTSMRSNSSTLHRTACRRSSSSATTRRSPTMKASASSQVQRQSCYSWGRGLLGVGTRAATRRAGARACRNFMYNIMSRPENQLPPELWYNTAEASKYESNTRIQNIQRQLGERAIELLNIEPGSFVLDIGCGSGISGETLQANGFVWEGIDISRDMLDIAAAKEESRGGLWQVDIGQGWRFRAGVFDGAVSVSTIQWLCVASRKADNPFRRCCKFFQSLYDCLRIGGRAVLQFYPDGKRQLEMITTAAMKSGFSGGLIVDYPNSTKAKKYFLVLEAGVRRNLGIVELPGKTGDGEMEEEEAAGEGEGEEVKVNREKEGKREGFGRSKKKIVKRKQFVMKKKERLRRRGLATKPDTKYTGRKRKPKF